MGRWLQLDDKIINLDQVTLVAPRRRAQSSGMLNVDVVVNDGASISLINGDGVYTSKSVEEVFRLIEAAEGPEPLKPLVDHEFVPALGSVYECLDCTLPQKAHAR